MYIANKCCTLSGYDAQEKRSVRDCRAKQISHVPFEPAWVVSSASILRKYSHLIVYRHKHDLKNNNYYNLFHIDILSLVKWKAF